MQRPVMDMSMKYIYMSPHMQLQMAKLQIEWNDM